MNGRRNTPRTVLREIAELHGGGACMQENGQRKYGPPPDWSGAPPPRGCEIFVGKIPRDCYEV